MNKIKNQIIGAAVGQIIVTGIIELGKLIFNILNKIK